MTIFFRTEMNHCRYTSLFFNIAFPAWIPLEALVDENAVAHETQKCIISINERTYVRARVAFLYIVMYKVVKIFV